MRKGRGNSAIAEPDEEEQTAEQLELENMPAASPIGRAARALVDVRDEIDEVNERLNEKEAAASDKLLALMAKEEKDAVVVDGRTFRRVKREACEQVRIFEKKGRKKKDQEGE